MLDLTDPERAVAELIGRLPEGAEIRNPEVATNLAELADAVAEALLALVREKELASDQMERVAAEVSRRAGGRQDIALRDLATEAENARMGRACERFARADRAIDALKAWGRRNGFEGGCWESIEPLFMEDPDDGSLVWVPRDDDDERRTPR